MKLLRWSDRELDGRGYVEWYHCDHPELGAVELGGWDLMYAFANVPPKFLEPEVAPHADFAIFHLLASPRLELHSLDLDRVGDDTFHVRLVVQNTGWLPTNVTEKALERKAVRPLEVELALPEGARIVSGERKLEAGQLSGRIGRRSVFWWGNDESTSDRAKLEWVVEAPVGGLLAVEVRHQRAGTLHREIELA
jgi:hypothetical protein